MATWSQNCPPAALSVASAMSRQLHYCSPHDPISAAEALMRAKQIRRLPVLAGKGQLLGIFSLADIAKETAKGAGPGLFSHELASTLADICRQPSSKASPLPCG
jgi:CBS-domain-containing membrane protein